MDLSLIPTSFSAYLRGRSSSERWILPISISGRALPRSPETVKGSSYNCAASIRDAISEGIIKGPRIVSCGLIVTPTETGNDTFSDLYAEADGPEEMRKVCRRELPKGNDFIKLMVSGAFMNEGAEPGIQIAEPEEIEAGCSRSPAQVHIRMRATVTEQSPLKRPSVQA